MWSECYWIVPQCRLLRRKISLVHDHLHGVLRSCIEAFRQVVHLPIPDLIAPPPIDRCCPGKLMVLNAQATTSGRH